MDINNIMLNQLKTNKDPKLNKYKPKTKIVIKEKEL